MALVIALTSQQSVFSLVVWAWGTLGAAFVPILLLRVAGATLTSLSMTIISLAGVASTVLWKYHGWPNTFYEGAAGMITGLLVGLAFAVWPRHRSEAT